MSETANRAVFLSYASQDAEAAKRIADALRAAGVEVWFDTDGGLEHGDEWDAKIRRQIKESVLFIPLISANTQAREEGYFRIEWELAAQRALGIASGVAFILPVLIDGTRESDALVPDRFRTVQWTKLPGGAVPPEVLQRFLKLWSHRAGVAKHLRQGSGSAESDTAPSRPAAPGPRWVKPVLASALIVIAVLAVTLAGRRERAAPPGATAVSGTAQPAGAPKPGAPANDTGSTPASPARQLAERAWTMVNQGSATRAQLDAAVELCDRALQLDPTDAMVWARAAAADLALIYPYGYDRSEERRRRAQDRAARASSLGADLVEVRVIQAMVFAHAVGTPTLLAEAEKTLRELIPVHPEMPKLTFQLAEILREQNRFAEAARLLEGIGELEVAGWSYHQAGELQSALAAVERSLRGSRSVTALQLKAILQMNASEDLAAAQATIDQLQPSELLSEMPAAIAIKVALFRRDPARMLEIARGLAQDYLDSNAFRGPRQFYTGTAHELAGRPAQAAAEWRTGLAVVETRLKAAPNDRQLLLWSAWLHAALGDTAEAERLFAHSQAIAGLSGDTMDGANVQVLLRLRRADALLAGTEAIFKARIPNWEGAHAEMRFSPLTDWLRGDPRFQKQLHDNLPLGAKPFEDQKTEDGGQKTAPPVVDQKSVAVLAFADLSAAHDSEYFSDGISEELLNVLAKIPGLKVAARTSAFYFKGKEVPIPEIAQQLGVAYVVEGSVRRQGDKVRITAQLIKAADGFHVWSDTFTRDLKDIFAVQDEIAGLIAKNLELKMGIGELGTRQAVSPAAYQEYLLGRAAAAKAGMADLREAVTHFERVVALEPKYTAAWVQLASAHTQLGRWGGTPTLQAWASARAAIDRARALEPDSPEVLRALGWILRTADWDWKGAERAFRRALALQPNQPETLAGAAVLLYNVGQKDEAFQLAGRAIQLDPLNAASQIDLSIMYYENGNWAEAEQAARRALELAPGGTSYHSILAWNLIKLGRYAEAEAEIAQDADPVEQSAAYGLLAIARGEGAKTREMLARLEELARTHGDFADVQQCIAWLYTGLGEKDLAFAAIEKAVATRDSSISWLRNTSELQALSVDPRWKVLLHRVGLTDEQLK